ncbi:hypothetical protein JYK14_25815 [Siccirubricoccus sp. KC 17139]|uniref:Uncharacterized protein n=1 Tax=Siccirubricoccus soli TaxID=2899147 RepID=A0ABT1DC90_9PROT|nr:hypothetical protein [Siccirubricoccus soli]MCO6419555.1 hypothetical protein [Siccirubricoccus soli]MCP2685690.1 hypothetical protein [Siccirubricoccus soli]
MLTLVARLLGMAIALAEAGEAAASGSPGPAPLAADRPVPVAHHAQDDSVFIEREYLVKGVPGRLPMWMLGAHQAAGRRVSPTARSAPMPRCACRSRRTIWRRASFCC